MANSARFRHRTLRFWGIVVGNASAGRRLLLGLATVAVSLTLTTANSAPPSKWPTAKPAASSGAKEKEVVPKIPDRPIVIKKVDVTTLPQVFKSAQKIDELVARNHAKHKIKPTPKTTDEQFVRRAYLDITGTIPTLKQVNQFVAIRGPDKRTRLIDTLLSSDGYASHFYNYWADVLRLQDNLNRDLTGAPYNEWVRRSLEENLPYDKFAYELVSSEGKYFDNPATGYMIRDSGMPLDAMSNTLRVFLGTQIGCAQCHNHPFDVWTQKEFYEMAAFTYPLQARIGGKDKMFGGRNPVNEIKEELKKVDPKFKGGNQYNRLLQGNLYVVHDNLGRKLKLPNNYHYDDAKPEQEVKPATILGDDAPVSKGEAPRKAFAKWMTSKDNPRFATSIANRLWKELMGMGLVEPVDNIRDDSDAENPELLKFLAAEVVRVNFDLKEYLRIILNSESYQRQACVDEVEPGQPFHYPGPMLRRMTAEQVWDSFVTLAVFDPEHFHRMPAKLETDLYDVDLKTATAQQIFDRFQEIRELTGGKAKKEREKPYQYKGLLLVRASELPMPAKHGHFLREFGQSDRELIQTSSDEGSVPQVLQMFNGPITHMLLEPGSLMYHNVMAKNRPEDRVNVIFLSILSRKPTTEEGAAALEEIKQNGPAGYGNVIWSLVNTREFIFIQ